jgi:hypothetical protein
MSGEKDFCRVIAFTSVFAALGYTSLTSDEHTCEAKH